MKYTQKIIEYGLYLLVFLLPMQTRWIIRAGELNGGYSEYSTYSLYATDILLILLLLLFIIKAVNSWIAGQARNDQNPLNPPLQGGQIDILRNGKVVWRLVGGLLLVSAVSVFFAANRPLALYKLGWLILGVGLFWLVVKAEYDRAKLIWSLLLGLGVQAGLGIWQFLFQSSFANKWLGLALHNGFDLGASVVETVSAIGLGERWLRAYGGLDHPNILGGVLAVGVLLLVGEYLKFPNPNYQIPNKFQIPNSKFQIKSGINKINIFKTISWFLLVAFTAALFFSFSRAAWLALAVGLAVWLALAARRKDLLAQQSLLKAILISGLVFFILFWQFPNLVATRFYIDNRLEVKSTDERIESIKNSLPIIKNNWLSGVGLGNYTLALKRELPDQPSYFYQPAHNAFVLALSETGMFGLLFFVFIILYLIIKNCLEIRNWLVPPRLARTGKLEIGKNNNTKNLMFNLSVLTALIVLFSLDHWLFSLHFGVLFFWLVIGLAAMDATRSPQSTS